MLKSAEIKLLITKVELATNEHLTLLPAPKKIYVCSCFECVDDFHVVFPLKAQQQ